MQGMNGYHGTVLYMITFYQVLISFDFECNEKEKKTFKKNVSV